MPITYDVTSEETGTSGNDRLVADALVSNLTDTTYLYRFTADGGDDTVIGSAGPTGWASLTAGQGAPVLRVDNYLYAGEGNDLLIASSGYNQTLNAAQQLGYLLSNSLFGGDGNDVLRGSRFADALYGDADLDTIYGGVGNDTIFGGDDNDRLLGGAGEDEVAGDAGADLIWGDAGNDDLNGGEGHDRVLGGVGADTLTGGDDNDSLFGGTGDDSFFGGAGDDFMVGDGGVESFDGGSGNDTYRLSSVNDTVTEAAGGGVDKVQTGSFSLYGNYQHVEILQLIGTANLFIVASDHARTLIGNSGNNYLYANGGSSTLRGGDGNDFLFGTSGDDVLYGGRHDDEMEGDDGNDWYSVDSLNDVVLEVTGFLSGYDTVSSAAISFAASDFDNIEVLELTGEADLNLTGGGSVTEMRGNAGNNTITTSDTLNESVFGGAGDDTIHVSDGNDRLASGDGDDVFVFAGITTSPFPKTIISDFNALEDKFDVTGLLLSSDNPYDYLSLGGNGYITLYYSDHSYFEFILTGEHNVTDANFIGLVSV